MVQFQQDCLGGCCELREVAVGVKSGCGGTNHFLDLQHKTFCPCMRNLNHCPLWKLWPNWGAYHICVFELKPSVNCDKSFLVSSFSRIFSALLWWILMLGQWRNSEGAWGILLWCRFSRPFYPACLPWLFGLTFDSLFCFLLEVLRTFLLLVGFRFGVWPCASCVTWWNRYGVFQN